jgi:glycosyltransferase 2 family protein
VEVAASRNRTRTLLLWGGVLVGVVCAALAIAATDPAKVWDALGECAVGWLVPALAVIAVAFFLRAVRWWSLFAEGRRPPLGAVARALFVGYLGNTVLPLRAGEPARVVALHASTRVSVAETTGTVVLERAYDVLSLLLLLLVGLPWWPDLGWLRAAALLGGVLLVAIAAAAVVLAVYGERAVGWLVRAVGRIPGVPAERLRDTPENLLHGLAGLRRPWIGFVAFVWTTLSWIVLGVGFWLVMVAFDLGLGPSAGVLIVIAIGLAMILPAPPAALGVFEGATVVTLVAYGIDESRALSYALVLHALNVFPLLVLGIPVLREYRGRARGLSVPPA